VRLAVIVGRRRPLSSNLGRPRDDPTSAALSPVDRHMPRRPVQDDDA